MTQLQTRPRPACGCDTQGNTGLISLNAASALIQKFATPVSGRENLTLDSALGRVLLDPLRARSMVPPFDNAAMDGYAVHTRDLIGDGPWTLPVVDRVAAGQARPAPLDRATAVQIFTGAPVPDGANAVVMQENVQRGDATITLRHPVQPGLHIRAAGEDMTKGKIVLPAGRFLSARDIATAAAAGYQTLLVRPRLRVALVVTGDEVHTPGQPRVPTGIWDVNTPMLTAALATPGIDLRGVVRAKDSRAALARQLADLSRTADLIITTGGISVGGEDHVKPALGDLGADITFSGVALKPGKPVSFGRIKTCSWLGLPGNPLSAFVTWQLFGTALCAALQGITPGQIQPQKAVLTQALRHKAGRTELRLARRAGYDDLGRACVDPIPLTQSGRVAQLPEMDGLIRVPSDTHDLPCGALVDFIPF